MHTQNRMLTLTEDMHLRGGISGIIWRLTYARKKWLRDMDTFQHYYQHRRWTSKTIILSSEKAFTYKL